MAAMSVADSPPRLVLSKEVHNLYQLHYIDIPEKVALHQQARAPWATSTPSPTPDLDFDPGPPLSPTPSTLDDGVIAYSYPQAGFAHAAQPVDALAGKSPRQPNKARPKPPRTSPPPSAHHMVTRRARKMAYRNAKLWELDVTGKPAIVAKT